MLVLQKDIPVLCMKGHCYATVHIVKKDKHELTEYVDHLWMVGTIGYANPFYQSDINYISNLILFHTGCNNASVYGSNCDTPCPTNCKDNTCHLHTGACFDCTPGWTGLTCNTSKIIKNILIFHVFTFSSFFPLQLNFNTLQQYLNVNILLFCKQNVKKDGMVITVLNSV